MTLFEVCAVISPLVAILVAVFTFRRGMKTDDREIATMLSDMGYIKSQLDSVQRKLEGNDDRHSSVLERLGKVEESTKSAHRRIDTLEIKKGGAE